MDRIGWKGQTAVGIHLFAKVPEELVFCSLFSDLSKLWFFHTVRFHILFVYSSLLMGVL